MKSRSRTLTARVLVSSDASLRDQKVARRPPLSSLVRAGFFQQMRELYGPPQTYEFSLAFQLGPQPFGDIRVGLSSALLRDQISPGLISAGYWALGSVLLSTLLALLVSTIALAPIGRISAQLDRISAGQFDAEPVVGRGDELGAVSTKIVGHRKAIARRARNFQHPARKSRPGDGRPRGRAAAFQRPGTRRAGEPVDREISGAARQRNCAARRVARFFRASHPLRSVLQIEGDQIEPAEGQGSDARRTAPGRERIGVSVQVIREHGTRMGTLVTLRDVESLERIGSQLQVSERLAALGRVTAGVAHEVKNPLNSMRLWLEVLKANMPVEPEPQQAVKMLDSEIDRLDRAVKTFLNFTRPVELNLEETDLARAAGGGPGRGAALDYQGRRANCSADLPADCPPVLVDRQLIHQAVLNLLLNASEFTDPGGSITLTPAPQRRIRGDCRGGFRPRNFAG